MLVEDVQRTEPFARMAKPEGASAISTLLQAPGSWWTNLRHGFGQKKTGTPRSWTLVCSVLAYIIGFLTISPLSSSLLTSEDVAVKRSIQYNILEPVQGSSLPLIADGDTFFKTIGNALQNVSTSAWITNDYYVQPFWPSSTNSHALGPRITSQIGTWEVESTVIRAEYDCKPMTIVAKGKETQNETSVRFKGTPKEVTESIPRKWVWVNMNSAEGCNYTFTGNISSTFLAGGMLWSSFDNLNPEVFETHTFSRDCQGKDIMLVTTPIVGKDVEIHLNFTIHANICNSAFYTARMPVTMTTLESSSILHIDGDTYRKAKVPVSAEVFDIKKMYNLTMDKIWIDHIATEQKLRMEVVSSPEFRGVASVIGAKYNFEIPAMLQSTGLPDDARRFRQRVMGEILQNSLRQPGSAQFQEARGQASFYERRVVVINEVGIAMAVLFSVSSLLLAATFWFSRLRRRPLHLFVDPSTPLGAAALVAINRNPLSALKPLDRALREDAKSALQDKAYTTIQGMLHETQSLLPGSKEKQKKRRNNSDWRPFNMRLKTLALLTLGLACLIVGLVVLKHFADDAQLHQSAFVYQARFSLLRTRISTIAPYSIVPTILAVVIGLWWDALDKSFRTLQPFLSMSKVSPVISKGAGLSYQGSYWAFAAVKAARNRHWLLFVVTVGTTLSQVFIVSMSALFERQPGISLRTVTTEQTLEMRQIPRMDTYQGDPTLTGIDAGGVMKLAYANSSSNWLYSGTIQLTLDGPEPPWSSQGWSFLPIDLSKLPNITSQSLQRAGNSFDGDSEPTSLFPNRNVTLYTSALRARLECSSIAEVVNQSAWLQSWDLNNKTEWNVTSNPKDLQTGYSLTRGMFAGEAYNTSILSHLSEPYCCENKTSQTTTTQNVALGYWSSNDPIRYPHPEEAWPKNFTTKWIHGPARTDYIKANAPLPDYGPLIFTEVPGIQALNCMPVIEKANAEVTVDQRNGHVYNYRILGNPVSATEAWDEAFVRRLNASTMTSDDTWIKNVTTSYGVFFVNSLLGAAQLPNLVGSSSRYDPTVRFDDEAVLLTDNTFNVRDKARGLNLDFMSYAMYSLANKNATALLDQNTLLKLSQRTFTTYFQHFVSSNVSFEHGGPAYQRIGQTADFELPYRANKNEAQIIYPQSTTNRTIAVTLSTRIEILRMNTVATYLSLGILVFLILTTLLIAALQRTYLSSLIRNFESPADILVAIAGSERFLDLVRDRGYENLMKDKHLRARLGWFRDGEGKERWGVELIGGTVWVGDSDEDRVENEKMSKVGSWEVVQKLRSRTKTFGL
ncbi:hypothetical protein P154DRAFT_490415 [Amniculicola lignicola CBS 123094]|uniref:Uncharacterized protein n=1 Tax=Amniculicola lignicola CBS 123094 TaxID=1392246 RepID=A0A6A5WHU8_9PLEO|nr:hypothetical protein P154DRAFT_490415 [Amniculicola lignicola CBS 123094]